MTVFTDKVDVDEKISLYEYGVIRDPLTGKTILCTNTSDYLWDGNKPKIQVQYIDFIDVLEALQEVDDHYFDYIGSTRENEINDLHGRYLADHIAALNNWGSIFSDEIW